MLASSPRLLFDKPQWLPPHYNTGQSHDIRIANRSFKNVRQLKYWGTTVASQNLSRRKLRGE
jgi:hypothetical protein